MRDFSLLSKYVAISIWAWKSFSHCLCLYISKQTAEDKFPSLLLPTPSNILQVVHSWGWDGGYRHSLKAF